MVPFALVERTIWVQSEIERGALLSKNRARARARISIRIRIRIRARARVRARGSIYERGETPERR